MASNSPGFHADIICRRPCGSRLIPSINCFSWSISLKWILPLLLYEVPNSSLKVLYDSSESSNEENDEGKDYGDDSQVVQDVLYDIYEELNNEIYKKTGFFVITIMEYVD